MTRDASSPRFRNHGTANRRRVVAANRRRAAAASSLRRRLVVIPTQGGIRFFRLVEPQR
jgi:hypothetical protein